MLAPAAQAPVGAGPAAEASRFLCSSTSRPTRTYLLRFQGRPELGRSTRFYLQLEHVRLTSRPGSSLGPPGWQGPGPGLTVGLRSSGSPCRDFNLVGGSAPPAGPSRRAESKASNLTLYHFCTAWYFLPSLNDSRHSGGSGSDSELLRLAKNLLGRAVGILE